MIKLKALIIIELALFSFCALFSYTVSAKGLSFLGHGLFTDGTTTIHYPCTLGGEPLVIYGTLPNNNLPISSQQPISPIYIEQGFMASPLEVSQAAQTQPTATDRLIIQTPNPATMYHYVQFQLQTQDGSLFYVTSVNFAAVTANADAKILAYYEINTDSDTTKLTQLPFQMHNFDQDVGVGIEKYVSKIFAKYYAWDEALDWGQGQVAPHRQIAYKFTPLPSEDNPRFYNGYGFWICGGLAKPNH